MVVENHHFYIRRSSMHKPFSIAMLNYQRVLLYTMTIRYNDEENDTGDSENDSSNSE